MTDFTDSFLSSTAAPLGFDPRSPGHRPDQADGLRRLFRRGAAQPIAVVSNPHVAGSGLLLERLIAACAHLGHHTLVVDAGEGAAEVDELTRVELASGVQQRGPHWSYLPARGLVMNFVDTRGSCAGLLQAAADAVPQADVVLVHAPAMQLARVFARRVVEPLLLADTTPDSVTHAYAGMKWLQQRRTGETFHALLDSGGREALGLRVMARLAECADHFLSCELSQAVMVDAVAERGERPDPELLALAHRCAAGEAETTPRWAPTARTADTARPSGYPQRRG